MRLPDFSFERKLFRSVDIIVAIDEAGRGAVAGPLTLGSVCITKRFLQKEKELHTLGVNDSKKIPENLREALRDKLEDKLEKFIVHFSNKTIDKNGIHKAFLLGVKRIEAFWCRKFPKSKMALFIDFFAYQANSKNIKVFSIKKGDEKCLSISIASIFAKTERDRLMRKVHLEYPAYNFRKNKGYGTKEHLEKILKHGLCKYHRKSFLIKLKAKSVK